MGMLQNSPADALFTRGQQRVLGLLFSEPNRSFSATDLIARAGGGTGAVHRELARLTTSGIATVTPRGRERRYQANRESPIFAELRGLILKTVGLVEPLKRALAPLETCTQAAFVYGPEATGGDPEGEISLMIIADVSMDELLAALGEAETAMGRPVDAVFFTPEEWRVRKRDDERFAQRVAALPKIFVVGTQEFFA